MSTPTQPTHWMDDRGLVVSDDWLKNDPDSTSDWRAAYNIPCVKVRGKIKPIPSPAPVQPQAEPVAEIIECSKMGQQTVKEIDGRWKFLDYGTKLYAGAAPVAQADKLDAEMFRWFMLGDRTTTDALLDLHMRQLNDDKPTLDEWRTAINAAMKGTP